MKFAVIIEKGPNNYSAYVPDLPGCVSAGHTLEETRQMIREAIEFHLEGMREDGERLYSEDMPPAQRILAAYDELRGTS